MLDYGDPVDDGFHSFHMMAVVLEKSISGPDKQTLADAIRIFKESTEYNAWRKSYTNPVNAAMDVILRRFTHLPKEVIRKSLIAALETA